MPIHIRTRVATIALIGVFLIPLTQSTLRGINHILTCTEQVETTFQISLADGMPTGLADPTTLEPGDVLEPAGPIVLCGGLSVGINPGPSSERDVTLYVDLDNTTSVDWFGTVDLQIGDVRVPIDLGRVEARSSVTQSIELDVPEGITEFPASLLIGP